MHRFKNFLEHAAIDLNLSYDWLGGDDGKKIYREKKVIYITLS